MHIFILYFQTHQQSQIDILGQFSIMCAQQTNYMRVSYNGYYGGFPNLTRGFDSRYPLTFPPDFNLTLRP